MGKISEFGGKAKILTQSQLGSLTDVCSIHSVACRNCMPIFVTFLSAVPDCWAGFFRSTAPS